MTTECTRTKLVFQGLDGRDVVGRFDGGEITFSAGHQALGWAAR